MILCMLLTIMLVMIVKVMPVFNQVYEQLGSQITGPAAVLLKAGEVLKQYWVIPAVFICIFAAGVWWLLKSQICFIYLLRFVCLAASQITLSYVLFHKRVRLISRLSFLLVLFRSNP